MAENFDLIFGQNASQQYAWSDNDYQNGWETIGNIPPTAAQFDALQRRSDTKMKELNDELTPLVNADTADSRQPSTTYSEGDIKYSPLLPTGWFLTCTTAGITSASEIVLPTPIAEGDTVTDGEVVWEIHKIGSAANGGDGVPLGAIIAYSANGELPSGYLLCDGSAVSRTMFPDLFDKIGTTYGAGDGSTTFNLPNYSDGKFPEGSTVAGTVKQPGLPNITGSMTKMDAGFSGSASIAAVDATITTSGLIKSVRGTVVHNNQGSGAGYSNFCDVELDASNSNPIYGNSDTVQPPALTARYIIKAFDGVTPTPAEADISEMLTELTGKADRSLDNLSADGENHFLENDFTIIYPNGGSEASPANVTNNSRYVETNPFPGYRVFCVAELLIDNNWGSTGSFYADFRNGGAYGTGTWQLDDSAIVIATGSSGIMSPGNNGGTPLNVSTDVTTAPCRVKVWKIGKIPD